MFNFCFFFFFFVFLILLLSNGSYLMLHQFAKSRKRKIEENEINANKFTSMHIIFLCLCVHNGCRCLSQWWCACNACSINVYLCYLIALLCESNSFKGDLACAINLKKKNVMLFFFFSILFICNYTNTNQLLLAHFLCDTQQIFFMLEKN